MAGAAFHSYPLGMEEVLKIEMSFDNPFWTIEFTRVVIFVRGAR